MVFLRSVPALLRLLLVAGLMLGLAACDSVEDRIAGFIARGEALFSEGKYEKARLEFGNALKLDPNSVPANRAMAGVMEKLGNPQMMLGHLQKVVEFVPGDAAAQVKIAQVLLFSQKLDEARSHAEAAVAAAPQSAEALATRAAVSFRLGNVRAALEDAEKAVAIEPLHANAGMVLIAERMQKEDRAGALTLATRYSEKHPQNYPLALVRLQILDQMADKPAIGAQLKRMVAAFPREPRLHVALAEWHQETGDTAAALAEYRAFVTASPGDTAAALDLVRFVVRTQSIEAGRAELARLAAEPGAPFAYQIALASFDQQNGRKDEAKALLKALAAAPGKPEDVAVARVALARMLVGEADLAGARAVIDEVLALDAKNSDALAIRAALHIEAGETEPALTDLRTALGETPRNPLLLTLTARAYQKAGNRTLAAENFAAAMQAADYAEAETLRYVAMLVEEAKKAQAETVLAEAVRRNPGSREMLTRLADLRLQLGDWAGAETVAATLGAGAGQEGQQGLADRIRAAVLAGQERYGESITLLEQLAADPDQRNSAMAALVAVYQRTGETAKAEAFLDSVLKDNPENPQALFLKGALKEASGDPAAAEASYRALLAAQPETARAWEILALFKARQGDAAAAVATLRDGLVQIPDSELLDMRLAGFLEQQGDIDGAIALYEKLFAKRPESVVLANNVVSLVTDHHAGDPARLARARQIAEALKGAAAPQLQDSYGWVLHLTGESEAALQSLVPAAEALPDNPWVRYHIGMAYAALGRKVEAKGHLEAALAKAGEGNFAPREVIKAELAKLGG